MLRWESSLRECWEEAKEGSKGALAFGWQLRRGWLLLSRVACACGLYICVLVGVGWDQ